METRDINFDGVEEFGLLCDSTQNACRCWFVWDSEAGQFRHLATLAGDLTLLPEEGSWRSGCGTGVERYGDPHLRLGQPRQPGAAIGNMTGGTLEIAQNPVVHPYERFGKGPPSSACVISLPGISGLPWSWWRRWPWPSACAEGW